MVLTITNAILDGEPVGLRAVDGTIAALGPDVTAEPGDEVARRARRGADPRGS